MNISSVEVRVPEGVNVVIGQTHFIKSVEDIAEIVVTTVPGAKFGLAFNEASGPCLVRGEGNDKDLRADAIARAQAIGAGHVFVLMLRDCYPINLLNQLKLCPEVCTIYCATANPVDVVIAESAQGRGVMGVIDGSRPLGVETDQDVANRKAFLRTIGYKR